MKSVKILSVFAVIAAAGMAAAGCVNLTGAGNGYDEVVFAAASGLAPESAGGTTALSAAPVKTIKVKFRVLNGGWGLVKSEGIITTQDNRYFAYGGGRCANDYTVTIIAPAGDEYLNVYWKGEDWMFAGLPFYISARMKAESGTITLDYNGRDSSYSRIATDNLYDVYFGISGYYSFEELKNLAGSGEFYGGRTIKVKFEVKNGGWGLLKSEGIVSTEDDGYLVYDHDVCANDFTITITVPDDNEYLNIRWRGFDGLAGAAYVRAKMKAESGTITLDYNGDTKVATKNLYDVVSGAPNVKKPPYVKNNLGKDWEDAKEFAVND